MCNATEYAFLPEDFKHIGDVVSLPESRTLHALNNDKIWFFGQKFVDQPKYNFGHHVVFAGTHSNYFDVTTNQWEVAPPATFPPISTEQNLEELLFVFRSQIFLFLFTAFGPLKNASLYRFDEVNRIWSPYSSSVAIVPPENDDDVSGKKRRGLILVEGTDENGVYFVDESFNIFLLKILDAVDDNSTLTSLGRIDAKKLLIRLQPTLAALSAGRIYVQGGVHGCGFRYEPAHIYVFDLTSKTSKHIKITDECQPQFGFIGSKAQVVDFPASNTWTHFTGLNHVGMVGSKFNGEIWTMKDLDTEPKWEKLPVEVPDLEINSDYSVIFNNTSKQLFVFSKSLGVLIKQL